MSTERAAFDERNACPSCGGTTLRVVWEGRFDQEPVRSLLARFYYAADLEKALGDEPFALVECADCALRFHRRVLTPDGLSRLYGEWINDAQIERFEREHRVDRMDAARGRGTQNTKHALRLLSLLETTPGEPVRVLDFGCGDGHFLHAASVFGFEAHGIDFSATRAGRTGGISISKDFDAFDALGTGPVDAATAFEVLEHVTDPQDILAALWQRIKPGGVLILEVPNAEGIESPVAFGDFHAVQPLEHINAFTPATLESCAARAGFTKIETPVAHVTTRLQDVVKTQVKQALRRPETQAYFRRST